MTRLIDKSTPQGTEAKAQGDERIRELKEAIQDIFGIPDNQLVAQVSEIVAAGLKSFTFADAAADPAMAGKLQRSGAALKFHNGIEVRTLAYSESVFSGVTVKDFGAVGDGVTDDTAAFVAALATGKHVFVPAGIYRIIGPLLVATQGQILCGTGYNAAQTATAPTVILKDGNFDGISLRNSGVQVRDLQVHGHTGNGGDGIVIEYGRTLLQNVAITSHGGNGLRIGPKTAGINANLWRLINVRSAANTGHGIYIHDAITGGGLSNNNAGCAFALETYQNGGDGIRIENSVDNTFLHYVAQLNTGRGVDCLSGTKGHSFWMPYIEANVAGEIRFNTGADQNVVWGTRQQAGESYEDSGSGNLILGRSTDINLFHVRTALSMKQVTINDPGVASWWHLRQGGVGVLDLAMATGDQVASVQLKRDSHGQILGIRSVTELLTINAAAATGTNISVPANAIIVGVTVRVTVAIPTATTFTVTTLSGGMILHSGASVSTAEGTTNVCTTNCPLLRTVQDYIMITPNVQPANDSGRVRVTVNYLDLTPPTS